MGRGRTTERAKPRQTEAHVVQTVREEGRKLVLDQPRQFKTAEEAIAAARRLADRKTGVAAYTVRGDLDEDIIEETVVLFRAGRLPAGMADAADD